MREILFKAKRVDTGEWVEGYYSPHPHPFSGFLKDFIFAPYYDEEKECGYDNGYQIDVNTLCQYTGLTDKNGNKIWENDVVTIKGMVSIGKVLFDKESCSYSIRAGVGRYIRNIGRFAKEIEVIGNIFDNPELLKGE